uniref:LysM domain-containing protein n=1 Tax=Desulfovibrio sp. U5L TaxID=596152 RepID=I2Q735_9BACT
MRNPSQALLLAVLMASLILPPGLPVAGAAPAGPAAGARRILLVGDSLSIGLGKQLDTVFAGRPGIVFAHLGKVSSGLANPAFFDWDAQLAAQVKTHHPDMVLIMLGANDDKPLSTPEGRSAAFGTRDWDVAYAERLGRLHAIIRADNPGASIFFIGVPVMGDPAFNTSMVHVNGVLARAARSLPGCSFIDVKDVLADPSGAFAPVAKAPDGGLVKLRAEDGVHISGAGSRLLAARCLEAVSDAAGLPKAALLASLEDKDLKPIAAAGASPIRLAEAAPAKAPAEAPAAPARPAQPAPAVKVAKAAPVPVVAPAAPGVPAQARPAAGGAYAVADGDTLWSVAKRLGVSPEALSAANPGIDPRRMSIGQSLAVPAGQSPALVAEAQARAVAPAPRPAEPARPAAASDRVHSVADGDNFWSVARRYDVTVAALTEANPGVEPTRLHIGQPLAIPGAGQAAAKAPAVARADGDRYVVADGDNFWSIARRFGIDAAELKRANAAVDPQKLQPGQLLALPGSARAEAGRTAPAPRQDLRSGRTVGDAALYPVAKGDTLWALSKRFGVDFATLVSANGELDPARLRVGQLVTIPAGESVASAESLVFPVAAGDTLWSIARRFDVSIEALVAANPGVDPLRLHEGQALRVPSSLAAVAASAAPRTEPAAPPAAAPADAALPVPAPSAPSAAVESARLHTVSVGDTLWGLSHRYGVTVDRILSENAGIDPVRLHVGQTLRLPGSAVAMAAR